MKMFFLLLFSALFLFAKVEKEDVYNAYKNKNFTQSCKLGMSILGREKRDENFVSVVGLSCINADMIDTAVNSAKYLKATAIGRNNASYIASIFLIKKLLLQFMFNDTDISTLSLPKSDHVLSIVFENVSQKKYKIVEGVYFVTQGEYTYSLSKTIDTYNKIVIRKFKGLHPLEQHIYW